MSEDLLVTARRFAAALDAEDYSTARTLLADGCVYHTDTGIVTGAEAIIESYRVNGETARSRFDVIEYRSGVTASMPSSAVIDFTDRVCGGGRWHEYHCRQHVRVGEAGLIEEIRHEEFPGERERLRQFEATEPGPSS